MARRGNGWRTWWRGMLRLRLALAARLDRLESIVRRIVERIGWPQRWLQEYITYTNEPRMALEEFWVRYVLKRIEVQPLFKKQMTEQEALHFYRTSDYMLLRNLVHRRHSAWRRVLVTMRGRTGSLLEWGCGVAPISAWVQAKRPGWRFDLYDIVGSPHFKYAEWRIQRRSSSPVHDVATLVDVLEHVSDPMHTTHQVLAELRPGGYLHWNFISNERQNDLDLASPKQHAETVAYLYQALDLVWEKNGYRVSRKR